VSYEPQPGTIPHRVIAWLRKHPTQEPSTAELAEAVSCDPAGMASCMAPAVSAGLVKRSKVAGFRTLWWSLGDGKPLPKTADEDREETLLERKEHEPVVVRPGPMLPGMHGDEPLPFQPPLRPWKSPMTLAEIAAAEGPPLTASEYIAKIGAEQGEPERMPFNACRYIDGSVIVCGVEVRDDGAIIFSPQQAAQLWRLAKEAV
jgi:hypothetical protein